MYAKNRSVFAECPRDAHPFRENRQISMAVIYVLTAIENATSIETRSPVKLIVASDCKACNRCDVQRVKLLLKTELRLIHYRH